MHNYNFYGDPITSLDQMFDKDEAGQVIGEDDLVAIRVDPITNAEAGSAAFLHFTSPNIRVWMGADKFGRIYSDIWPISPTVSITLYVEGMNLSGAVDAEKGVLEAMDWLETGEAPINPRHVALPPFER